MHHTLHLTTTLALCVFFVCCASTPTQPDQTQSMTENIPPFQSGTCPDQAPPEVAACVSGVLIETKTVEDRLNQSKQQLQTSTVAVPKLGQQNPAIPNPAFEDEQRKRITKNLITQELLRQYLVQENVPRPTETPDNDQLFALVNIIKYYHTESMLIGMNHDEENALRQSIHHVFHTLSRNGTISPVASDDVKDVYTANIDSFSTPPMVQASHILVKLDQSAPLESPRAIQAKKKIDAIHQAATRKGADFAKIAMEKSEGPSAPRGGELGFFTRGRMIRPFEDVAFATPKGEISSPVRTRFGWHIIHVTDIKPKQPRPLADVEDIIRSGIKRRRLHEAYEATLQDLRTKKDIRAYGIYAQKNAK